MNKVKIKEFKSLFINLADRSSDNSISEKLTELKNSGNSKVNLEVKTLPENKIKNLQLDIELFQRIKEVQDLPDWVIIRMILAARKLKDSNFKMRISNG